MAGPAGATGHDAGRPTRGRLVILGALSAFGPLPVAYGISPQLFSVIFAVNSAVLIAVSPVGACRVGRVGPVGLLRRGLAGTFLASLATLVAVATMAGLWPLLVCLAALMAANGLVLPNGTAGAPAGQDTALGAACALLGLGQFGAGAVGAPLVGMAGSHDALPPPIVIAVAGTAR